MYKELHEDMVAYASINKKGEPRLQATPPFNDGAALSETHDTEHIKNDSVRHTSVQSKTNTHTYTRMENSHDDIYIYINNFLMFILINEYLNHFLFEMLTSGSKRNLYFV